MHVARDPHPPSEKVRQMGERMAEIARQETEEIKLRRFNFHHTKVLGVDWRQTSWLFEGSYDQFLVTTATLPQYCGHIGLEFEDRFDEFGYGTWRTAENLAKALSVPLTNNGVHRDEWVVSESGVPVWP